ncbi:uncharacterized protein LOC132626428 [Lycium barbarum]|uniref:uncharacterized protein LOC132626428 n=1 Tax=Lycium barbarum TaxID=112863 RepID=UPI00293F6746|nr:uncharacterized protein LOC132626428 [Lycium barbarum]XP_060197277.1 uncharacterized protein LOC132626428 [Lycium barbarum]
MACGICEGAGHNAWGCKKPLKAMKKRQRSAIAQSSKGKQPADSLKSSKGKKSFDVGQTSKIRQATSKRMRTLINENSEDEVTQTQKDSQSSAHQVSQPSKDSVFIPAPRVNPCPYFGYPSFEHVPDPTSRPFVISEANIKLGFILGGMFKCLLEQ